MRRKLLFLAFVMLNACKGHVEVGPKIVHDTVPVAVQPIKAEEVPTPPAPLPKRPDTLSQTADMLLASWCRAVAYIVRAHPLLRVSAGLPPADLPAYPECKKK